MEGEQTWPTQEELEEAEENVKPKPRTKRVPKGTSEYQAAWILDSEGSVFSNVYFSDYVSNWLKSDDDFIFLVIPACLFLPFLFTILVNASCYTFDIGIHFIFSFNLLWLFVIIIAFAHCIFCSPHWYTDIIYPLIHLEEGIYYNSLVLCAQKMTMVKM